jgi:hypothetical protein
MRFYNLRIYVNEIGFHAIKPSEIEVVSSTTALRSWYYSAARNESLIRCLQATKDYLDRYLALTLEDIANLTLTDIISLVYAVLILGTFATGACDSQSLNITHTRQTANLDYYLDSLSDKAFQQVSASIPGSNNYMSHLYELLQHSRIWYAHLVKDPTPTGMCLVERPNFSFMKIIPMIVGRCVDISSLTTPAKSSELPDVSSDEQWAEMLSSWGSTQDLSTMTLDASLV